VLSAVVFWERSSTENRFKSTVGWSSQGCPNLESEHYRPEYVELKIGTVSLPKASSSGAAGA
jgi:hypothetical protein